MTEYVGDFKVAEFMDRENSTISFCSGLNEEINKLTGETKCQTC